MAVVALLIGACAADISVDPNGLLARTLPVEEQKATVVQNATYERRGALQFQSDPARSAVLFSETGMDLVAMAGTKCLPDRGLPGLGPGLSTGS